MHIYAYKYIYTCIRIYVSACTVCRRSVVLLYIYEIYKYTNILYVLYTYAYIYVY